MGSSHYRPSGRKDVRVDLHFHCDDAFHVNEFLIQGFEPSFPNACFEVLPPCDPLKGWGYPLRREFERIFSNVKPHNSYGVKIDEVGLCCDMFMVWVLWEPRGWLAQAVEQFPLSTTDIQDLIGFSQMTRPIIN